MSQSVHPKAFVSHSSKDKKRFVLDFATRLRERGIDAWLDKWEMLLGYNRVDIIFEEGIKNFKAVSIILSKHSIDSPWVKEELDVGVVQKIQKQTRFIPIIIDEDIEIPTVLSATLWKKIPNLESYDDEFEEIVNAILGIAEKPPLGDLPKYAFEMTTIGSLSQIDSKILKLIVEYLLETNPWTGLSTGLELASLWTDNEIPKEQVEESLEILDSELYIDLSQTSEGWFGSPFLVTGHAIIDYAENYIEDFDKKVMAVISKINNENIMRSDTLAEQADLHIVVVNTLILEWEDSGYIQYTSRYGGDNVVSFRDLSAMGKRYFKEQLSQ